MSTFIETKHQRVSLGTLSIEEPCYGTSATAVPRTNEQQPKYIRITDFDDFGITPNHEFMAAESYSDKHLLRPGDILFARTGGTVGKTYYYDGSIGPAVFAGYCIRFRFDEKKVLPKFVYWCTKTKAYSAWVNGIQRPSGQPNINKEEYKSFDIHLPSIEKQITISKKMDSAEDHYKFLNLTASSAVQTARDRLFAELGISVPQYTPSLIAATKLRDVIEIGLLCNPHWSYLSTVFSILRSNKYYAGHLEDVIEINPRIEREELSDGEIVSFVPMPAVREKENGVCYEKKLYKEVKIGFTPFQRGDLLWAKITPCMQNGKSFLSDDMPTKFGFGSTEFHVLRKRNDRIYMPFLWVLLSDDHILEAAQGMFSGSAGQQRVPDTFLKKFPIILPPIDMQRRIADEVFDALDRAKKMKKAAEAEWTEAKAQFEKELLGE